jgi:hypothetical protein
MNPRALGRASAIARRAPPPRQLLRLLEEMRYAEQARELDRFFGRVQDEPAREIELPLSQAEEFALADQGTFGGPAVQRMLQEAEYNQAVTPPEETQEPLADMLGRMERIRNLDRINLPRRPQEVQDLAAIAQESIDAARASRMAEPAEEAAALGGNLLTGGAVAGGGLGGYSLMRDLGTILEQDDGLLEMGQEFDLPTDEPSYEDLALPEIEEPLIGVPEDLPELSATEVGIPDEPDLIDSPPDDATMGPETEIVEEDSVLSGRPMIPGLSPLQQRQMDALVMRGVEPMRALRLVRGQEAMSMDMLRSLRSR